ncbi:OLC1v1010425C1 [Oldenlandia corymbosa var. corymbosa]|uniref:OLC1v1010425C1 n=1 Tax=Oldenlandia corymbosa var. corymbosa TaxID=529605 RepID=A0AAV1DUC3_OLDCO|nr:OLC1v1010425C1 [Oldenlandia corymbosa var. corymbosa]
MARKKPQKCCNDDINTPVDRISYFARFDSGLHPVLSPNQIGCDNKHSISEVEVPMD